MDNTLSNNLIYFRKQAGYSQELLAEKLHVSRQTISRWECNDAIPDTENLIELSKLYGVSLDLLVNIDASTIAPLESNDSVTDNDKGESNTPKDYKDQDILEKLKSYQKQVTNAYNKGKEVLVRNKVGKHMLSISILSFLCAMAYVVTGLFIPNTWGIAWLVFLLIPFIICTVLAIKTKKAVIFCYPLIPLAVFYAVSWFTGLWHPMWLVFMTIPIYYIFAVMFDKRKSR